MFDPDRVYKRIQIPGKVVTIPSQTGVNEVKIAKEVKYTAPSMLHTVNHSIVLCNQPVSSDCLFVLNCCKTRKR